MSSELPIFVRHNHKEVFGFFGDYRWLSNFTEHGEEGQVVEGENVFTNAEAYYQSRKVAYQLPGNNITAEHFSMQSGLYAKKRSRKLVIDVVEWDKAKRGHMEKALEYKFRDPELRQMLVDTGDRVLTEANWWGDRYWGTDEEGRGNNVLGRILMRIRSGFKTAGLVARLFNHNDVGNEIISMRDSPELNAMLGVVEERPPNIVGDEKAEIAALLASNKVTYKVGVSYTPGASGYNIVVASSDGRQCDVTATPKNHDFDGADHDGFTITMIKLHHETTIHISDGSKTVSSISVSNLL
jgi:ribA/ribD-fused uncharacterized protein